MSYALFVPASGSIGTVTGSGQDTAPVGNMTKDHPAMVWRSTASTAGFSASLVRPVDTVALWATNLTDGDRVRVRLGPNANGSGAVFDQTVNGSTNVFVTLPSVVSAQHLRIDITRVVGVAEVSRLIASKRIVAEGINTLAEHSFDDQSVKTAGAGWTVIDTYPVLESWKVAVEGIEEDDFYDNWYDFIKGSGERKSFIFVPIYPHKHLGKSASWGRMMGPAKDTWITSTDRRIDMTIGTLT